MVENSTTNATSEIMFLDEISSWLWKVVAPIIFTFGIIGNILIVFILIKMEFWKKLTYTLILVLAISDMMVLASGLCRRLILEIFEFDIRTISNIGCKFSLFLVYFSMHISSWTLVCISTERCIRVKFPLKFIAGNISTKLILSYVIICVLFFLLDSHFFWTNGLVISGNSKHCNNTSENYFQFEERYFSIVDMLVLSVIPCVLIFPMNISFWIGLRKSRKFRLDNMPRNMRIVRLGKNKFDERSKTLTTMMFFTSIYFLGATLPISVLFIVDSYIRQDLPTSVMVSKLNFATSLFYLLQYTNYSVNFFIYITINRQFRKWLPFHSLLR